MQWLSDILTSSNAVVVLSFLLVFTIIGIILVKKGLLRFKGKGVELGNDKDRNLIRDQWDYTTAVCEGKLSKLHDHISDVNLCKHIIDKVVDLFQLWIIVNAMSDNENYVKAKQKQVYAAICKRYTDEWIEGDEFKSCCNRFVEDLIRDLVRMKQVAS